MYYFEKHPKLFTKNRSRFVSLMKKKSVAIFISNDELIANGDGIVPYQQNSDLFWHTSIAQDSTMLILCPDYPLKEYREILVVRKPNPLKEKWDGKQLTKEEATQFSGIEKIVWEEDAPAIIHKLAHENDFIYLPSNEKDRRPHFLEDSASRFAANIKSKFPLHTYLRSAPLMKSLRGIKTKEEITILQKAVNITNDTFKRVLAYMKPGVFENEVEGVIHGNFLANRSVPGYSSIVASGVNACTLHYISNHQECKKEDLVLMDFGARYSGYCADLSRTIPVSGKFSKRQKEVYNACLRLHSYAKSILKPGISIPAYTEKVGKQASKEFLKIGLLRPQDLKNEDKQHPAYRRYLYHGISHHLGIDVHDLGETVLPIKQGMYFTIEPGIYIAEEKIGVRIENNFWVTANSNKDLMKNIPITVDEIEACMQKK